MNPLEALLEAAAGPASTTAGEAPNDTTVSSERAKQLAEQFPTELQPYMTSRLLMLPLPMFLHAEEFGIYLKEPDSKKTRHLMCLCPHSYKKRPHRLHDCNGFYDPKRHCGCKQGIPFKPKKLCKVCSPEKFCALHNRRQCPYGCHADNHGTRTPRKNNAEALKRKDEKKKFEEAIDVLVEMRRV